MALVRMVHLPMSTFQLYLHKEIAMPRLPIPGTDTEHWGDLLNEYLRVAHRDDGTFKIPDTTYWTSAIGATTHDSTA